MTNSTDSSRPHRHNLHLSAPINRWDEAIPLGNGMLGVLLWGEGNRLKLSLDRGDLWDLREPEIFSSPEFNYATIKKWVAEKKWDDLVRVFEAVSKQVPYPTKLPAGRIELTLGSDLVANSFDLDLGRAIGTVELNRGKIEVFCSATSQVIMLRGGEKELNFDIVAPFNSTDRTPTKADNSMFALWQLEYQLPQTGQDGDVRWTLQQCAEGFAYAVVVACRRTNTSTVIAVAVVTNKDDADPVALGRKRVTAALDAGFDAVLSPHAQWWRDFWSRSSVKIPHEAMQQHYELVQYFYGAASRPGSPPIALQGVWTADQGAVPPWRGDYHHDLNTQFTYYAYQPADHLNEGKCFLDWLWNTLPAAQKFAKDFFDAPGACWPCATTIEGKLIAGWQQYTFSPGNAAWLTHLFYMHWRYTMDRAFLTDRAYPLCEQVAIFIEALLEPDERGKLKLPLSSSPEIHDNRLVAWVTPNSNYDLSLMRWLFGAMSEMATTLGKSQDAKRWSGLLDRLDDLAVDTRIALGIADGIGSLMVAPDEKLTESHRHFSHLMAIHPLGTINVEGDDRDRQIITESLRYIDRMGTGWWCGYSFSWMACMAARAALPERALHMLDGYLKAFISRNGFHLNGDFKKLGLSCIYARPFTLEGNFAAAHAVHEMLLQSWNGRVRLFPAVPQEWKDVEFDGLRAEGAFKVSAKRSNGKTVWVRILAERDGILRLSKPFGETPIQWNRPPEKSDDKDFYFTMKAGTVIEGRLV